MQNSSDLTKESNKNLLIKTKQDHEEFLTEKAKSAMFHLDAKFFNEGEKPTKYFLNLEKSKAGAKTILSMLKNDGQIKTTGWERLIRSYSSARFSFKLSENLEYTVIANPIFLLNVGLKNYLNEKCGLEITFKKPL